MAASHPTAGGWAEAQRVFRDVYADDDGAVPRTPVFYRVQPRGPRWRGLFLAPEERTLVIALWSPEAPPGEVAALAFDADRAETDALAPEGYATVAGDPVANGTLCLEAPGGVVWPTYNPRVPWGRRAPRR